MLIAIGLLNNMQSLETLRNNLDEAEYTASDISVISYLKDAQKVAQPAKGKFQQIDRQTFTTLLSKTPLSQTDQQAILDQVKHNAAVVIVTGDKSTVASAKEMLLDAGASYVCEADWNML